MFLVLLQPRLIQDEIAKLWNIVEFDLRPSFLLALMFGVLACAERLFSRADWTIAHVQPNADGLTAPGRPVYTMQQSGCKKMKKRM